MTLKLTAEAVDWSSCIPKFPFFSGTNIFTGFGMEFWDTCHIYMENQGKMALMVDILTRWLFAIHQKNHGNKVEHGWTVWSLLCGRCKCHQLPTDVPSDFPSPTHEHMKTESDGNPHQKPNKSCFPSHDIRGWLTHLRRLLSSSYHGGNFLWSSLRKSSLRHIRQYKIQRIYCFLVDCSYSPKIPKPIGIFFPSQNPVSKFNPSNRLGT